MNISVFVAGPPVKNYLEVCFCKGGKHLLRQTACKSPLYCNFTFKTASLVNFIDHNVNLLSLNLRCRKRCKKTQVRYRSEVNIREGRQHCLWIDIMGQKKLLSVLLCKFSHLKRLKIFIIVVPQL